MTLAESTILVVDDEPDLLEIFGIWLKREGATVLQAANGDLALKALESHRVDALVSDIHMPVMDGVTLVQTLFNAKRTVPTTIFVSGFGEISPRLLYSLGVETLLSKPLPRNLLVQTLAHSLRPREELWIDPSPLPAEKEIAVSFPSLTAALELKRFALGRGGCCLHTPKLHEESVIEMEIHFSLDVLTLKGQAVVRWYDAKAQRAGLEFVHLDAGSRRWVTAQLAADTPLSFIHTCD